MHYVDISSSNSSFRAMPVLYTSTRILKPFEDCEPTGLKVDIAKETESETTVYSLLSFGCSEGYGQ